MNSNIKTDGNFKYVEMGEGPILLLLHGLFGALTNWSSVMEHFRHNYKVVIPIMPIYEMPLLKTNVRGLNNFIHKFVEYKEYPSVVLLGNSLGGHVALMYAQKHPDLVDAMILTGSSGLYENAMGGSFPKRHNYDYIREKVEYTFYDPKTASKELVDECFETINDRSKATRILAMAKSAIRHNMGKELSKINTPSCLIWGKNDKITPEDVAEEFHVLLPNSELHFIDKCGHAPMMEQPVEFNRILEDFLTRLFVNSTQVER